MEHNRYIMIHNVTLRFAVAFDIFHSCGGMDRKVPVGDKEWGISTCPAEGGDKSWNIPQGDFAILF